MTTTAQHDHRYAGIFTPTSSDPVGNAPSASVFVSPGFETRTLLESIYAVSSVDEVGSDKFVEAYCVNLERLSVQAHWTAGVVASAQSHAVNVNGGGGGSQFSATPGLGDILSSLGGGGVDEEYVVEAFLENVDRLEALVRTMLALEFWRENVLFIKSRKIDSDVAIEEEEVEFEIEGGERGEEEADEYDDLNDVDGGEDDDVGGEARGLARRLADNGNALRAAFVLHAETTIVSLLSLIFYKGIPAGLLDGSGGDDVLLSLVDYCARQLIFLGTPEESNPALSRQKNPLLASQLSGHLHRRPRIDEIRDSMHDSAYQTAIASVTLARYLCENVNEMGPSLLSRMLEVHDFPLLMVPLVEEPPWTRRRSIEKGGKGNNVFSKTIWEKLDEHNEWKEVPTADLLLLTKLEGQPWIALFHLTASKVLREGYGLDEYRKSRLMRLRKYVHRTLVDQLPVLEELARYLDELSILGVPPSGQGVHRPSSSASSSGLLLRRVDSVRESIVERRNVPDGDYWERIAWTQWEKIFSRVTDSMDEGLRRIASEVYGGGMDDAMANVDTMSRSAGGRNDLEKEEPHQSTVDDWKVALSKPIRKISLNMEDGSGNALATFELIPAQNGGAAAAITDTPLGPYQRVKMSISQTGGKGGAVFPRAKVVARVCFQNDPPADVLGEVTLSVESLALPTAEHDASLNGYDEVGIELPESFPSKEWRQLGDLEGRSVVLQLGFKRLSRGRVPAGSALLRGYALSHAFLSQPLAD